LEDVLGYEQDMSRFCIRTRPRKMPPNPVRLRYRPPLSQLAERRHLHLPRAAALRWHFLLLLLLLAARILLLEVALSLMTMIPVAVVALMALELVEFGRL
jgi:hypothetical protein